MRKGWHTLVSVVLALSCRFPINLCGAATLVASPGAA